MIGYPIHNKRAKKEVFMRLSKAFILFCVIMSVIHISLFSSISSRLEGVVTDEETGKPIGGAYVSLFLIMKPIGKTLNSGITDSKGRFRFEIYIEGDYFITVSKDGFADVCPMTFSQNDYSLNDVFIDVKEIDKYTVKIKRGTIQHLQIKMEKEAILNITVFKKMPNSPEKIAEHGEIVVFEKTSGKEIFSSLKGQLTKRGLKVGNYKAEIYLKGYSKKIFDDIVLEKGITKTINFTADFSVGQTLHGYIYYEFEGVLYALSTAIITMEKIDHSEFYNASPDLYGEYWIGGFSPGEYILKISSVDNWYTKKKIDFTTNIKFILNEKKEIVHEL